MKNYMENLLNKILEDCDEVVREYFLAQAKGEWNEKEGYKNWQVVEQPALVALHWQQVRDHKNPFKLIELENRPKTK